MRSSRFLFGLLIVVAVSTSYLIVGGFTLGPRFNITNETSQSVAVIAKWRDTSRDLGAVEPDSTIPLTVRDEASMVFTVQYPDGSEKSSEPIYFTNGMTIEVSILEDGVNVQHDFEK